MRYDRAFYGGFGGRGMRRRLSILIVLATMTVVIAVGGAAASVQSQQFRIITLRHTPTHFTIHAPEGFRLQFRSGVYVLRKGVTSMSFSRLAADVTPAQLGEALFQALGGRVLIRAGDARHTVGQVANGQRGDTFVVERVGSGLAITTSTSSVGRPVALETLRQIGLGATGGVTLRPPRGKPQPSIPLRPYRSPDGGATALVPAGNDWDYQSNNGAIVGYSPNRGSFIFGYSLNIPVSAPGPTPSDVIVGPYLNAVQALTRILPRIGSTRSIHIRRILVDRALPSFTSSGMILFDYRDGGRLWTAVATVATDDPSKYSNFLWNFYYSGIAVPAGSSSAVGVGLLRSWKSWDPSGAIAARTRAGIALINETNEIWQQTNEFRSQQADQQSRDVGCLLQGYYIVEDNARHYGLPALPCGQIYTER
jgi:hypothetical protein